MANSYDFSRLKVLVVDDSVFMRRVVHAILNALGVMAVDFAEDGSAALERLKMFPADVVICDWDMQPMNGALFLRRLRMDDKSPNAYLSVIMLTGYTERAKVEQARELGVTEFLAKPVTPKGIHTRLVAMVENPRPFVRTRVYFGPCRRRLEKPDFPGDDRRHEETAHV